MITALNCSIGRDSFVDGLDAAVAMGLRDVELWWPFPDPDPTAGQIDDVVAQLRKRGLGLVALNMFGGDLAAGERGILHDRDLPEEHIDAIERFHDLTGVARFNLLLGRGGTVLTTAQLDRFAGVAGDVEKRFGGTVMVEPMSGTGDYPVRTVADAAPLLEHGGLLLDLYHLAVNDAVTLDVMPEHVQAADNPGRGAPGTGELPLADWVAQLRAGGYTGHVVGEWLP